MTRRRYRSVVFGCLALGACANETKPTKARIDSTAGQSPADALAADIERRLPQLRRDTAIVFGLAPEGAKLTSSYAGDTLRRLRAEYLGETGRAIVTYYFDSALVLVVRSDYVYTGPMSGRVVDSTMRRYDLTRPGTSPTAAADMRAEAKDLLARLRQR